MTRREIRLLKQALWTIDRREIEAFERLNDPIPPFSEEFNKNMQKLLHPEPKRRWQGVNIPKKRLLTVAFAVIMIVALTVSASAVGKKLFPFIVTFWKDAVGLQIIETPSRTTITEHYTLDEVPTGYQRPTNKQNEYRHITEWWRGEDKYIALTQDLAQNTSIHASLKEGEYQYITLRGTEMMYVNSHGICQFIWQENGYSFTFLCPDDIPWEDIVRMVESIRPEE